MPQLRQKAFMTRTELIKVLLSVPGHRGGEPVFTIYEVRGDTALTEGQSRQILPLKVNGRELVIDLAPREMEKMP